MRARTWFVVTILVLAAPPARAWFEVGEVGARAAGVGDAFVSVADDASAVYWNPAGLVQLPRHEALLGTDRAGALEGLSTDFAALSVHAPGVTFGIGWRHLGEEDTAREDALLISAAHTFVRRSLGAFIAGGATLELLRVGLDTTGFESVPGLRAADSGAAATLGVLLQPIPNVTAGAVMRHLGRPTFDLIAGGARTQLDTEVEWGLSLRWREDARLHVSHLRTSGGRTAMRAGAELRVGGALWVRAGVASDAVSGGIGIALGAWELDWAYRIHDTLGSTSRVGIRRGFGHVRDAVGTSYDDF
jgi:hypothetical protein